jgi:Lon protease-like protein
MLGFLPIFPLQIVVYPGEQLNLHIFEPRYKQLIKESMDESKPFGIPTVLKGHVAEWGCSVEIVEVVKTYDNGELDITLRGDRVFRILEVVKEVPDKLYSAAIVEFPLNEIQISRNKMPALLEKIRELHQLLKVEKLFPKPDDQLISYDVAHRAGLSLEEEFELLTLLREDQRQEYLRRHLNKIVSFLKEMEDVKERIKMNGQFRNLDGLEFDWEKPKGTDDDV